MVVPISMYQLLFGHLSKNVCFVVMMSAPLSKICEACAPKTMIAKVKHNIKVSEREISIYKFK